MSDCFIDFRLKEEGIMKMDKDVIDMVKELWNLGYSTGEIARMLSIDEVQVVRVVKKD